MNLEQKIQIFSQLGEELNVFSSEAYQPVRRKAEAHNRWFTQPAMDQAIIGIQKMLDKDTLRQWLETYKNIPVSKPQNIGVVMAGNIPMVGFHDFLSVLVSGHRLLAKLSSQDEILMKEITKLLIQIAPEYEEKIAFVDVLKGADAYIATGSNNSSRYFEYYFSKKPSIIRKNRNSCAILNQTESLEDLGALTKDLFVYFGLGCRNVSKIYVPEDYQFDNLLDTAKIWEDILRDHNKYSNNYDYNKAIYMLNETPFYDNGFLILKADEQMASPVATLHYETYQNQADLEQKIQAKENEIQVIVSKEAWYPGSLPFGQTQEPEPGDYADGIDTIDFLVNLAS